MSTTCSLFMSNGLCIGRYNAYEISKNKNDCGRGFLL